LESNIGLKKENEIIARAEELGKKLGFEVSTKQLTKKPKNVYLTNMYSDQTCLIGNIMFSVPDELMASCINNKQGLCIGVFNKSKKF